MVMNPSLPKEIATGASLIGSEYGWQLSSFPDALTRAEMISYACLGGQFQVRLTSEICEMYWLSADSEDRYPGEDWDSYCRRSCAQVREKFERLATETDFLRELAGYPHLHELMSTGTDIREHLVFVAYFINEREWLSS
jgi:hypothetical protein